MVSPGAAAAFMATHARALDRRRYELAFEDGNPDATLAALNAYRNVDGGYGRGLEPDLRAAESQPVAAMHAFEVFSELGSPHPEAAISMDWLDSVSRDDGGLPFALEISDPTGCAPFWAEADHETSSLHMSAAVALHAHRAARHDQRLRGHPWLERCTSYCVDAIEALREPQHALELMFSLRFLDAVFDTEPRAAGELERWAGFIPPSGQVHVGGGLPDEMLRPMDFAPEPGSHVRDHLDEEVVERDLERVAGAQEEDGGWPLAWHAYSPAAALEWRGYVTLAALLLLEANDRL